MLIVAAFLAATIMLVGPDTYIALVYQSGTLKILCICVFTLLLSYYFDLYEPQRISMNWEIHFRLLLVLSALSFSLATLVYFFPKIEIGPHVLASGIAILAVMLLLWRSAYERIIAWPIFRERVYVLGNAQRAHAIESLLRSRRDLGMEVVRGMLSDSSTGGTDPFAEDLHGFDTPKIGIDRIIVALEDRRGSMPVQELLALRLRGVVIEESGALLERLSGMLPLDGLNPSALIFTHGFNTRPSLQFGRRLFSITVSSVALAICLPLLPFLILAVRLSSPGPIFFRQVRVGFRGRPFTIYKFRTMRLDAEANGAVWATKNDPRITPLGRFMRKTRLDEIPQLWNVLRGDMGFVGPRPERPEFVQWLVKEIPYYNLRHMIRPGLTGWAQVRYQYGASLEETKRKLEYDLYYIKHLSLGLDLLIMFETVKTILLRRGAQ
ncbi:MAG TPA: TIGR03013 family XrtA/PEP-CTERM system glycosyltransferase [Terracidiphilus sp.]|nr:TIGR03013 family XrtA/PEP-CTERM system glycosyltransferase [Terracidiphilus sp.]